MLFDNKNLEGLETYIKIDEIISKVHDHIDSIDNMLKVPLNDNDVNSCIGILAIIAKELVMEPIKEVFDSVDDTKLEEIMTDFAGEVTGEIIKLLQNASNATLDDVRICRTHLYNASEDYSIKIRELAMAKYNPGTLEKIRNMSAGEHVINEDMLKITLLEATLKLVDKKPDDITNINWHVVLDGTVKTFNRSASSEIVDEKWMTNIANKLSEFKTADEIKLFLNRLINDLTNKGKIRTFDDVAKMEAVINSIKKILDTESDEEERRDLTIAMIQLAIRKKLTTLDVIHSICHVCDPIRERKPYVIEQIKRELDDIVIEFKPTEQEMIKFTHLDKIKNGELKIVIEDADE